MKKKSLFKSIVMLLMCLLLSVSLSSCGLAYIIADTFLLGNSINTEGVVVSDSITEYLSINNINDRYFNSIKNDLNRIIDEGTNTDSLNEKIGEFNAYYEKISTSCRLIQMRDYAQRGYDKSSDSIKYYNALSDLADYANELEIKIANSNFKAYYFNGLSDEEINNKLHKNKKGEEIEALESKSQEILDLYHNLKSSSFNYSNSVNELYKEFVENNKKIASYYNEASYLNYIYKKDYSRDITTDDALLFISHISEFNDLYKDINTLYQSELRQLKRNTSDYRSYMAFIKNDTFKNNMDLIMNYAEYMGSDFYDLLSETYPNGYIVTTTNSNSVDGAFTMYLPDLKRCGMYFSGSYQNIMTFIHEFGHNYALTSNKNLAQSLDTEEIHSQANELLFLNYFIKENPYTWSDQMLNCLKHYKIIEMLDAIYTASSVAELEIDAYSGYSGSYTALSNQILSKYSSTGANYSDEYWSFVVFDSEGYYISYALSAVCALDIYCKALTDEDNAKAIYKRLCTKTTTDGFVKDITDAGLENVFEISTLTNISNVLEA